MFKYQNFPLITKEFYDSKGILRKKSYRMKSGQPISENHHACTMNVIDVETSKNLTLKQIYKTKNLSKSKTLDEISNHQTMNFHDNFIKLEEIFEDKENVYLFMEQNGNNLEQLLQARKYFLEKEVQYIFCQLVTILENLRKNNIAHGQITLNQLFINPKTMKIKLSGFYKSFNIKKLQQNNYNNGISFEPTSYSSPQLLGISSHDFENYFSSDIWSVGVVLFTLLTGKQPFLYLVDSKIKISTPALQKIKKCSFEFPQQPKISTVWRELIKKIFQPKDKRISLKDLIWHKLNNITETWFTQLDQNIPPSLDHHFVDEHDQSLESKEELPLYNQTWNINFSKKKKKVEIQINKPKLVRFVEEVSLHSLYSSMDSQSLQFENPSMKNILLDLIHKFREKLPLVLQRPQKIQKYIIMEQNQTIGYLINNSIGVLYSDGNSFIGHNETEFRYIDIESGQTSCGKILLASRKSIPNSLGKIKSSVSKKKLQIYKYYIDSFGERVIVNQLNIWLVKYWKIDSIMIFLLNTGIWQLNFDQGKHKGIVIIDKYDLGWWFGHPSQQSKNIGLIKISRNIIKKLKQKFIDGQ